MRETRSRYALDLTELDHANPLSAPARKHIDLQWLTSQLRLSLNADSEDAANSSTILTLDNKRKSLSDSSADPSSKRPRLPSPPSSPSAVVWTHVVELTLERDPQYSWDLEHHQLFQNQEDEFHSALKLLGKAKDEDVLIGTGYVRCLSETRAGLYKTYVSTPFATFGLPLIFLLQHSHAGSSSAPKSWQIERTEKIMTLPYFDDTRGRALDFSESLYNLLYAAGVMAHSGHLQLEPVDIKLRLHSQPVHTRSTLPVFITLEFRASLDLNFITNPIDSLPHISSEAQRRLLSFIFPQPPNPAGDHQETDIRYFFSCLSPAPALPDEVREEFLQHPNLQVQLLPFQRRSLYFLLEAEGYTLNSEGHVVALPGGSKLSPLWEPIDIPQEMCVGCPPLCDGDPFNYICI